MKFAEHLGAHITPEWRKQYIQYEVMKEMLYQAQEEAPSAEMTDESVISRYFARFDETFFQFCDKELAKINTFFYEKISEATRKYATLKAEMQTYSEHEQKSTATANLRRRRSSTVFFKDKENKEINRTRKLHDLKLAFSEFYLSLILLQNYQTLNFTGFRKILKKHDKLMETTRGVIWRQAHVDTAAFYTNKEVDHLISEVEQNVTSNLEGGNRQKAMKRLRVPPLGDKENPMTTFRMGFFCGVFLVLSVVVVISAFYTEVEGPWEPALRMYRGMFIVILDIFLLGINTYGWRSSGVNHVLIFEIDPRRHLTHQQLMELSATLAVIWCISVLLFLFSGFLHIPGYVFPLALAVFMLFFLLNPFRILYHSSRMWLLKILGRIFLAPYFHVGFADFWLADQLNSLVTVLLDFEYMVCFYAVEVDWLSENTPGVCTKQIYGIRTIISVLPAWWRFAQCLRRYKDTKLLFPHFVNAGKYSTTFFTAFFSTMYHIQKGFLHLAWWRFALLLGSYKDTKLLFPHIVNAGKYSTTFFTTFFSTMYHIQKAWWMFAQLLRRNKDTKLLFPHIVNAGKYSTTFFTAFFSTMYHIQKELYGEENRQNHAFFYLWICSAVISSCYTLTWDLKMDWGLLDSNPGENKFLREEIVYAYKFYYYFAIVEDFILRFIWSLTVSIGEGLLIHNEILTTLLTSLEIFRRFVWNFFRLENEHLNNCGQFRAVRDISIAPIDSSDLSQLIDLMDDEGDRAFSRRIERQPLIKSKIRGISSEDHLDLHIGKDNETISVLEVYYNQ